MTYSAVVAGHSTARAWWRQAFLKSCRVSYASGRVEVFEMGARNLIAGPRPGNDIEPLERDLAPVVAEPELCWRRVETLQCSVDLRQLARSARRVRFVELLVHRIGADVCRVKWHQREISGFLLLRPCGAIGDNAID